MDVPWDEFRPDVLTVNSPYARTAKNVFPTTNGYAPIAGPQAYSSALAARCYGLGSGRLNTTGFATFAGTTTKLYKLNGTSWSDVSRTVGGAYNVPTGEFWRFAQFGTYLYAVNVNDAMQRIDVNSGANFAAVAGSPPNARNVSVVGDFLVLSSTSSDPRAIYWSAINDPTGWTVGTSLSDTQTFPDGGRVTGVAGGETGYVLQEYAIRRMTFLPGSDYVFSFEKVVDGKGCISPYAYETVSGAVFFLAEDGFYAYTASGLNPVGSQRVNAWFLSNVDKARLSQVYAFADPVNTRIHWAFYSSANATVFDRIIIYDWFLDRWSYAEISAEIWGTSATTGVSLDSLSGSIDAMTTSFDDASYAGGRLALACIDATHSLAFMTGSNLAATLETGEFMPQAGQRARVNRVIPIVDTTSATLAVAPRNRFQNSATYGAEKSIQVNGTVLARVTGQFLRARLSIPAGTSWTNAQSLSLDPAGEGVR